MFQELLTTVPHTVGYRYMTDILKHMGIPVRRYRYCISTSNSYMYLYLYAYAYIHKRNFIKG